MTEEKEIDKPLSIEEMVNKDLEQRRKAIGEELRALEAKYKLDVVPVITIIGNSQIDAQLAFITRRQ